MRYRVTLRGEDIEIRGYATIDGLKQLSGPDKLYMVVASPAEDDYDPFSGDKLADLTPEEANGVDKQMADHMYHHRYVANTAHMACDPQCRTDALAEAIRRHVLMPRREA